MSGRAVAWLVVVLTAAFLIGLWYRDDMLLTPADGVHELVASEDCDPRERECLADDQGLGVAVSFPDGAPLMTPFPIEVRLLGVQAGSVSVDFQMRDMEMGVNRVRLQRTEPQRWHGSATLPVCTTGRADWLAAVEVETESGLLRATFPFAADKP